MFKLSFKTGNAAFHDDDDDLEDDGDELTEACRAEIARILRDVADRVRYGTEDRGAIADVNGNTVGTFRYCFGDPARQD